MMALKTKMVFLTGHIEDFTEIRNENRLDKLFTRTAKLFSKDHIVKCKQFEGGVFHSDILGVRLDTEDDIELLETMALNFAQTKILYCSSEGIGRRITLRETDDSTSRLLGPYTASRTVPPKDKYIFIPDNDNDLFGTYFYFDAVTLRSYRNKMYQLKEHNAMFED